MREAIKEWLGNGFGGVNLEVDELKCIKLRNGASIPSYGTEHAACFDLSACFNTETKIKGYDKGNVKYEEHPLVDDKDEVFIVIEPNERVLVPTGLIFEMPVDTSLRIHPRSGLSYKHGITLANAEGVVDADYPNETFVMLTNTSTEPYGIKHGDRIAQAELVPLKQIDIVEHDTGVFQNVTDRNGGFGSTGK